MHPYRRTFPSKVYHLILLVMRCHTSDSSHDCRLLARLVSDTLPVQRKPLHEYPPIRVLACGSDRADTVR